MVAGFFAGHEPHVKLRGCSPIPFDPQVDIVRAPGNDPGVWRFSRDLLRAKEDSHRRAVVILDDDWNGSPGPAEIRSDVSRDLAPVWPQHEVIVIVPELETWFWRDNPMLWRLMRWKDTEPLSPRQVLERAGLWPSDQAKPPRPKEAIGYLKKKHRIIVQNATFGQAAEHLSVRGCTDESFLLLAQTLRKWFPVEVGTMVEDSQ